jgi:cellobiose phosphorylase
VNYGTFDNPNREYVITNPKTPTKWVNYIGTLAFGGFVDHTGGGVICKQDPSLNRITKYMPQLPNSTMNGETLYIRVRDGKGQPQVFSPFFAPTLHQYSRWECRVGLGYSRWIHEGFGLKVEITIFVPFDSQRVLRDIKVTNTSTQSLDVDVIPVVEYTHFDALKQFTNADWVPQTMQSRAIKQEGGRLVLTQYAFMHKDNRVNYLTCDQSVSSFESDRQRFLGDNGYGTWQTPGELKNESLSNYEAHRGDNIGALLVAFKGLKPGETRRVVAQLGQMKDIASEQAEIDRFRNPANVDKAFAELSQFWDAYLAPIQVETPSPDLDNMVNIHNPRQSYITKNWSRYLSLYQLGLGDRGIGFRDSSQDCMGILPNKPEEARELMEKLLSTQNPSGNAMHQFNPLTMEGQVGDSHEMADRPKYYGDDHLWIVLTTAYYIKETGDFGFLDKQIPFYAKKGVEREPGTVLEHLERSVAFSHSDTGKHGLPLAGFADWNDTINLRTGAESLFNANLYGTALRELVELFTYKGDTAKAAKYQQWWEAMKKTVNDTSWDGEWWTRYFDFDGTPVGTKDSKTTKLFMECQPWSVLSGFAEDARARACMDSVNAKLNTRNGLKLSWPSFNKFDPNVGGATTYPPGAKENGGIFLHTNPWCMIAETMLGNGDRAFEYYNQINPSTRNERMDEYEIEPYVYAQNILGDEHPQFGLGRNSWLSGTSSWTYQAAHKYILGLLPDFAGLRVDPCIPKSWDGFKASRVFRGVQYRITVKNAAHVSKGVKKMLVDGKEVKGTLIPYEAGKKVVDVVVELG